MARNGLTFKFEGLKQIDQALGTLGNSTGKNILRRVGREALMPFDKEWRLHAPFDRDGHDFLHLRDSGGVGSNLSRAQRRVTERESTVEVFAGPGPHPKAVQDEFGNEHQAPQPYLRPSWEKCGPDIPQNVANGLRPELDKTLKRLERKAARLAAKNKA